MTLSIELQERPAMHYVGISLSARLDEFGAPGGPNESVPRIFQWLAEHQRVPSSGPLYIFRRIGGHNDPIDLTVAVPIAEPVEPSNGLIAGSLPAGRYVVARHVGHPDGLFAVEREMLEWTRKQQVVLDVEQDNDYEVWTARAEHFLTDPQVEPDASKWVTELLVLTR